MLIWRTTLGDAMRSDAALANGTLYIGNDDGKLYALDAASGLRRWQYDSGGPVFAGPTLSHDAHSLFIGSTAGVELKLDCTNVGKLIWEFPPGLVPAASIGSTSTLSADGDTLFFGAADGSLYAVRAVSGTRVWTRQLGGAVGSESVLTPDGTLLLVGAHDGYVYAVSTEQGKVVWRYQTGAQVQSDQILSADGRTLYIGSDDHHVYALDVISGMPRWIFNCSAEAQSGFALSAEGTTLYFGSYDTHIYSVATVTGSLQWKFATGGPVGSRPALSPDGSVVYQPSFDGNIYALAADTGEEFWRFATDGPVHADPVLSEDGGVLYVGSFDHSVYALNTSVRSIRHPQSAGVATRRLSTAVEAEVVSDGRRRGARRKRQGGLMRQRARAAAGSTSSATVDPLGYYWYSWSPPTDACGTELHADYDGIRAHTWGSTFRKESAAECCAACVAHRRCNSWVYCPAPVCFSPDVWNHTKGECWLKEQREPTVPAVNMRGQYTPKYRARHGHHHAPLHVAWVSGVPGSKLGGRAMTNGTWSGRAVW